MRIEVVDDSEIWKKLPDFENIVEASNLGNFRRVDRKEKRNIKLSKYSNGYLQFSITINSKRFTAIAHRLTAQTFIKNPENKKYVNHKNGIKDDNRAENLEWVTHSENIKHSYETLGRTVDNKGIKNPKSILTEKEVLDIRKQHKFGIEIRIISEQYGVKEPAIWKIVNRYTWKHI